MLMQLKNWPIGIRVGGSFAFLILGMTIIAYSGWMGLGKVQDNARGIYQDTTVPATNLANMATNLLRYRNRVIQAVGAVSEEDFAEFIQELPQLEKQVMATLSEFKAKQADSKSSGVDFSKNIVELQEALEAYWGLDHRTVEQVRHSWKATTPQEGERLRAAARQNTFFTAGPTLDANGQALDDLLQKLRNFAQIQNEEASLNSRNASRALWIVWGVCGTVVFLLGSLITRGVKVPLDRVNAALADIGRGDLTRRVVQDSRDEMGQLSANMNEFVQRLHGTVSNVAGAAQTLTVQAHSLSDISSAVSRASQQQVAQATHAASAVEEMSVTVQELAKNAHDVTVMAEGASKAAQIGGSVVAQAIRDMGNLRQSVEDTGVRISNLGKRSQEISEIVKVITAIADQTNLLALNAAIEAARAGEQGRGFAVVADEVRKLAERTTKATSEISSMIAGVQLDTTDAVSAMQTGRTRVEAGVELVNEAGEHLNKILGTAKTVTEMVQHMAGSITEQSVAAAQLATNVNSVAILSRDNETSIDEALASAAQLSTMAKDMQGMIHQFKLGTPSI